MLIRLLSRRQTALGCAAWPAQGKYRTYFNIRAGQVGSPGLRPGQAASSSLRNREARISGGIVREMP
jgi:hypothetical protein